MPHEKFLTYLARYISLTPEEENVVISKLQSRKYLKGQYVVQQGDVSRAESFVLSGCTKTFYVDKSGQEHIVLFSIEDWWTGDIGSFITQSPADYNVQCLEDSELLQFSFQAMEELCAELHKMERFFRLLMQNALVAAQKRIVGISSLTAKERFLEFRKSYPQMEQRIPQYMIASYLGITKEFLSKVKSQLAQES